MGETPAAFRPRVVVVRSDADMATVNNIKPQTRGADYVVAYSVTNGCPGYIRFLKCRWPLENIPDGEWCEILDAIKKCEAGKKR